MNSVCRRILYKGAVFWNLVSIRSLVDGTSLRRFKASNVYMSMPLPIRGRVEFSVVVVFQC